MFQQLLAWSRVGEVAIGSRGRYGVLIHGPKPPPFKVKTRHLYSEEVRQKKNLDKKLRQNLNVLFWENTTTWLIQGREGPLSFAQITTNSVTLLRGLKGIGSCSNLDALFIQLWSGCSDTPSTERSPRRWPGNPLTPRWTSPFFWEKPCEHSRVIALLVRKTFKIFC